MHCDMLKIQDGVAIVEELNFKPDGFFINLIHLTTKVLLS